MISYDRTKLNPIELVWGVMKTHLRAKVKPKDLQELEAGIREFWKTLKPDVCSKFIGHLSQVIPIVAEKNGEPSSR